MKSYFSVSYKNKKNSTNQNKTKIGSYNVSEDAVTFEPLVQRL